MSKQDMLDALAGKVPTGAVPIWELGFHPLDQATGRHAVLGHEFEQLTPAEQEKALHANAEIMIAAAETLCFSALSVPTGFWYQAPGDLAFYVLPGESRFKQAVILKEYAPSDLALVSNVGGVMGMPGAENYMDFSYRLFDDPDGIEQEARDLVVLGLNNARRMADAGVDIVYTASDLADNHGMFYNPEQMDRFVLPFLDQWAREVHAMGMPGILHTDGNLMAALDSIADTAVDAIQAIDPTAGMDIVKVQEQVSGRLALCGNIDCGLLLTGPEEEIYAAARDLLTRCKAKGGLVLGASNAVVKETPVANYRAMLKAWEEYGRY